MVTPIVGAGTDETQWRGWRAMTEWPALTPAGAGVPLVVAPHPDDEILGVAGLMALAGAAEVIAVTDGEASHPDSTVYPPRTLDGHPDHEAVGRAAAAACAATGAVLLEYPIWTWHWARPGDERVPWKRARRIDLPPAVQTAKAHAIAAFRSQITALGPAPGDAPVLPPHVLARFARPFEVVFA